MMTGKGHEARLGIVHKSSNEYFLVCRLDESYSGTAGKSFDLHVRAARFVDSLNRPGQSKNNDLSQSDSLAICEAEAICEADRRDHDSVLGGVVKFAVFNRESALLKPDH